MFVRSRRRSPFFALFLFLFGIKAFKRERMSDAERAEYKAKARSFRKKMHEAFSVWDEEGIESTSGSEESESKGV